MIKFNLSVFVSIVTNLIFLKGSSGTISCFVCSSRNGSYTECEDPFNAGYSTYRERCKVPRRGHIGEFPAHFCIKIIGTSYETKERIVMRRCVSENMDNQCGNFRFGDDLLHGCILTCDLDGCNAGNVTYKSSILIIICTLIPVSYSLLLALKNDFNAHMISETTEKSDKDRSTHVKHKLLPLRNLKPNFVSILCSDQHNIIPRPIVGS